MLATTFAPMAVAMAKVLDVLKVERFLLHLASITYSPYVKHGIELAIQDVRTISDPPSYDDDKPFEIVDDNESIRTLADALLSFLDNLKTDWPFGADTAESKSIDTMCAEIRATKDADYGDSQNVFRLVMTGPNGEGLDNDDEEYLVGDPREMLREHVADFVSLYDDPELGVHWWGWEAYAMDRAENVLCALGDDEIQEMFENHCAAADAEFEEREKEHRARWHNDEAMIAQDARLKYMCENVEKMFIALECAENMANLGGVELVAKRKDYKFPYAMHNWGTNIIDVRCHHLNNVLSDIDHMRIDEYYLENIDQANTMLRIGIRDLARVIPEKIVPFLRSSPNRAAMWDAIIEYCGGEDKHIRPTGDHKTIADYERTLNNATDQLGSFVAELRNYLPPNDPLFDKMSEFKIWANAPDGRNIESDELHSGDPREELKDFIARIIVEHDEIEFGEWHATAMTRDMREIEVMSFAEYLDESA